MLKWLPISVLYISIGCLQFLWCSYQPQPCIRARFLLCEFVNWYQRLYCVVCTWLWFWVLGGAALQVDAADQTRIQTKKCIYIYILTVCTHQFLVLWWLCPEAHIKYKVSWQNSSMCRKNWRKVFWGIVHHYISRFNSFQADVAPFRKQRPSTLKKPSGMAWRMAPKKILGRVWFV